MESSDRFILFQAISMDTCCGMLQDREHDFYSWRFEMNPLQR